MTERKSVYIRAELHRLAAIEAATNEVQIAHVGDAAMAEWLVRHGSSDSRKEAEKLSSTLRKGLYTGK